MTLRSYANKRDKNEAEIVEVLRKAGCSVFRLDKPCDLLVGFRRQIFLVEVKAKKGKLTKAQSEFAQTWRGPPVFIIRSVDGALETIKRWSSITSADPVASTDRRAAA